MSACSDYLKVTLCCMPTRRPVQHECKVNVCCMPAWLKLWILHATPWKCHMLAQNVNVHIIAFYHMPASAIATVACRVLVLYPCHSCAGSSPRAVYLSCKIDTLRAWNFSTGAEGDFAVLILTLVLSGEVPPAPAQATHPWVPSLR